MRTGLMCAIPMVKENAALFKCYWTQNVRSLEIDALSHRQANNGEYRIDIYKTHMPATPENLTIKIDRATFTLDQDRRALGEHAFENVAETITITDPELTKTLLLVMRRGNVASPFAMAKMKRT